MAASPTSAKEWLGYWVSCWINARLRATDDRGVVQKYSDIAKLRPTLLGSVDDEVLVATAHGFNMFVSRRSGIGQTLITDGQWEGLLSRTLLACLQPDEWAIDVGANIGYDTLLMSQAVGRQGLVFAFEPEPENLSLLLRNLNRSQHRNVVVHSLALSDGPALARISLRDAYYSGRPNMRDQSEDTTRPILATRLDQLLKLPEDRRIGFVKMDIEGFEFKALLGMGDLVDRVDHLSCEINHQFLAQCGSSGREIFDYMQGRGFTPLCAPAQSGGKWARGSADFQLGPAGGTHFDVLFCRRESEALRALIA